MNTAGMCTSFKREALCGIHAFGTSVVRGSTTPDSIKAALYLASASLDPATTAVYSVTGEVVGTNYTPGGNAVTNATQPAAGSGAGYWTPSADLTFTDVTFPAPVDAALFYNATQGNKAIEICNFGAQQITAGDFILHMPANDAVNALVRITA